MTQDEIIEMAEQAGFEILYGWPDSFYEFAKLVAQHEREACAKVAEAYEPRCDTCPSGVANAIRARSNT